MEPQKKTLLDYTMHYGALLGIFWIIKYSFFIGENYWVHFIYFYHLLNVVSPLLMYIFYLRYKSETPELLHNIWRCVLFVLGISFFGSLFESVIIYAHYSLINPDFFVKISAVPLGMVDKMIEPKALSGNDLASFEQAKDIVRTIFSSKITYLVINMLNQLFIGFIFSLLIGLLTRNRNLNNK